MNRSILFAILFSLLFTCHCGTSQDKYVIPTVVKLTSTPWFERMKMGVDRFTSETSHDCFLIGPMKADAALQAQIVDDMIEKNVDALSVVPFSPEILDPVLEKALKKGIVVITHEASDQQHCTYDLEAFNNRDYGVHLMTNLAECMGGSGQYAVFVGNLTSKTHNEWVDSAIAFQTEFYPEMQVIGPRMETFDDRGNAYQIALQILDENPDLKGFLGSAATDVAGFGEAITEMKIENETCVVGTSLPSISDQYLKNGSVDMISFWDPADAGYVMNLIAVKLLNGELIKSGDDLGVYGYHQIRLDGKVIYGNAWQDLNKNDLSEFPF